MVTLAAATATHHAAAVVFLLAVGAAWAAGYLVACAIWPFGHCRRCQGTGRLKSPSGRKFRLCPRCKHTGRRLRFGRRVWNYAQRTRKEGTS